ncbi:MAG: cytochrome c biogenesis protein CcdA, partial [Sphaerobacter sp.]|nr:cytochrome c biogenesis protein CcdA [Sphaerobacter sp.]
LTGGGPMRGLVQFVSYALGMATIVVSLTVALSLFKAGLVGLLRRALPYVQSAAAALLVLAGLWIVLYWSPELLG